eukprot:1815580-Pyramimonas_sp.AAC.1
MLQETTRVPPMTRNYLVPHWARFFRIKADTSVPKRTATVVDRLNWAQLTTTSHRAGKAHCVELSLRNKREACGSLRLIRRVAKTVTWYVSDYSSCYFGGPSIASIKSQIRWKRKNECGWGIFISVF